MSLSPSFPWPATRSPRHQNSCEAEPGTCWAYCVPTTSWTTMSGACGRAQGMAAGAGSAELGPGADPGVSDGRKKYAALVVRISVQAADLEEASTPDRTWASKLTDHGAP